MHILFAHFSKIWIKNGKQYRCVRSSLVIIWHAYVLLFRKYNPNVVCDTFHSGGCLMFACGWNCYAATCLRTSQLRCFGPEGISIHPAVWLKCRWMADSKIHTNKHIWMKIKCSFDRVVSCEPHFKKVIQMSSSNKIRPYTIYFHSKRQSKLLFQSKT